MFGPLLVTDVKRRNWSGSVEALWSGQMFLTNSNSYFKSQRTFVK